LFQAARPILLNGIDDVIGRSDLADRALFLYNPSPTVGDAWRGNFGVSLRSRDRASWDRCSTPPRTVCATWQAFTSKRQAFDARRLTSVNSSIPLLPRARRGFFKNACSSGRTSPAAPTAFSASRAVQLLRRLRSSTEISRVEYRGDKNERANRT